MPIPKPTLTYATLVGRIVEHHRKQQGIHQEAVAQTVGISQSAYSRLEKGQTAMSVTQLRLIAEVLNTTPERLLQHTAQYANQLRAQGVDVTDEKPNSAAGVLIALGILAALFAAGNS
ncbi:MAG: helix-turn-helix transcriptional regulator [Acidimicrobiaceae bacterium]|nr:helix-turn-helix transcriptional regulator [Acidimicrobiaceae bacterium]